MTTVSTPRPPDRTRQISSYLTADELAIRWRKTPRTIQRMVNDGKLAPVRINRSPLFDISEVEAFEHNTRGLARVLDPAPAARPDPIVSSPPRLSRRQRRTWYTICIAHTKGGVGKTSTTWYLAREFTSRQTGKRVVLRDLDDQTEGLTSIFEGHGGSAGDQGALFSRRLTLAKQPDDVPSLRPDVVLIDTPPFTPATVQLIDQVDMVLIPVLPEYNAVRVLERMLTNVTQARWRNPLVRVLILPTRFRRSWPVHTDYLAQIRDLGAEFTCEILPPVPDRMSVQVFAMAGHPWQPAANRLLTLMEEDARDV
jgi:cellulose biosynthesis protein BcsQ